MSRAFIFLEITKIFPNGKNIIHKGLEIFITLNRYRGIGIRIEDNIIIGHGEIENMTTAPKEIEEIENLMLENISRGC